ncbi:unnamed protein product, partial [Amoebophrya sp. A120]
CPPRHARGFDSGRYCADRSRPVSGSAGKGQNSPYREFVRHCARGRRCLSRFSRTKHGLLLSRPCGRDGHVPALPFVLHCATVRQADLQTIRHWEENIAKRGLFHAGEPGKTDSVLAVREALRRLAPVLHPVSVCEPDFFRADLPRNSVVAAEPNSRLAVHDRVLRDATGRVFLSGLAPAVLPLLGAR